MTIKMTDMLASARKINVRLAQAKQVTLVPGTVDLVQRAADAPATPTVVNVAPVAESAPEVEPPKEPEYSVYRFNRKGERGERASKSNLSLAEAEAYVAKRPDNKYEIVQEDD